jgi:hypothetical protein
MDGGRKRPSVVIASLQPITSDTTPTATLPRPPTIGTNPAAFPLRC